VKARIPLAALAALAALAVASPPASAAGLRNAAGAPRVQLPGDASAASVEADPATWIVGARDTATAAAIARAHGARRIAGGAWLAPRAGARTLATALRARRLLDYAEPNRIGRRTQAPDPLSADPASAWRSTVVGAAVPPPVGPESPLIGVVDTMIDLSHPEIAGSNITTFGGSALRDFHGTATSTVAAAPANGLGMLGVWPGARTLNLPLPNGQRITCADSARGIARAVRAGAAVINMSYGSPSKCAAEEQQINRAVKAGAVPVAASGNEFEQGNPPEFPASLAHVLTVGAVGADDKPAFFSNESAAVDLAAPGVGILTAVPAGLDPGNDGDGFHPVDGTSFSAPMVSAAVAWIRAARPDLTPFQAAQVVRLGARDVGKAGWDSATGFGVLNLPGALAHAAPIPDPLEPNDDIEFVNGRVLGRRAVPVSRGVGTTTLDGLLDRYEDPADVYRIRIPPRATVQIRARPRFGDPDLYVFTPAATSVMRSRGLVAQSRRRGRRTEGVLVTNPTGRTVTRFVALGIDGGVRSLDSRYTLRIRRR